MINPRRVGRNLEVVKDICFVGEEVEVGNLGGGSREVGGAFMSNTKYHRFEI